MSMRNSSNTHSISKEALKKIITDKWLNQSWLIYI